ncbi:MAG: DUF6129 family protein [Halothiobacillaceae bacterium]|jgi:hypothetical protein|nr:DUF6129 family protein [Halothiobacillaceae bacterium]MDY0050343.1 DUF6129 family protein [Halothiobacillaceae bacterium]
MIDADTLGGVVHAVEKGEYDPAALRARFPTLHFTVCSEDDVPARLKPVAEGAGFALFYLNNTGHCVEFTTDPAAATGLVIARLVEDD